MNLFIAGMKGILYSLIVLLFLAVLTIILVFLIMFLYEKFGSLGTVVILSLIIWLFGAFIWGMEEF